MNHFTKLGLAFWLVCLPVCAQDNKIDPLFADIPQENDRDLVVEIVDWGWVGGLMRRGRLRIRERDFNRALSTLARSSKKGMTNSDLQGGIRGLARSTRGTAKGALQAVQNAVILLDVTGKVYVWNTASGAPVPIPENHRLYEQIEEALHEESRPETSPSETKEGYLEAFHRLRQEKAAQ